MEIMFLLKPEVPGQFGPDSIITNIPDVQSGKDRFLNVKKLCLILDGWLGDDLLTTHPCYIITKKIYDQLVIDSLSGFELEHIEVKKSLLFNDLHPEKFVPELFRLKPTGKVKLVGEKIIECSVMDFNLDEQGFLYVSNTAMKFLEKFSLNHCAKFPREVQK